MSLELRGYHKLKLVLCPRNYSWYGGVNRLNMEANRFWIRYWALEKNAPFISIGRETGRILPPSPYFGMELRSLTEKWNYERFVEIGPGY